MRTAYFHEDDYGQFEILPLTAKAYCMEEMRKIEAFEEPQTGSYGFSDIYIRGDSPHSIEELSLRSEQLHQALGFLPAYDLVTTGYSTYTTAMRSTYGRGFGKGQNVFWSVNEEGIVTHLWLDLFIKSETKERWWLILITLGQLAPVLLADWAWEQSVDLTSQNEIEQYIAER